MFSSQFLFFAYDPNQRIKASQALNHDVFSKSSLLQKIINCSKSHSTPIQISRISFFSYKM
ncbi:hypothetical protein HZS_5681 [Henneguya salminicola]|nr:hypothetical protein HZS_5681 [Henneguya salminicola]